MIGFPVDMYTNNFDGIYGTPVRNSQNGLISGIGEVMTDDKKILAKFIFVSIVESFSLSFITYRKRGFIFCFNI